MTRALITGASSYLGRELARQLDRNGHEVHVLARASTRPDRLPELASSRLHVHDGTSDSFDALIAKAAPDVTFHLASHYSREPVSSEIDTLLESNFVFGVQLLEALRRSGRLARIVNATTHAQFFESSDPRPLDLYAACKRAFHDVLTYYADAFSFDFVSLVIFDVYGPDDHRFKFVTNAVDSALGGTVLPLPSTDVNLDLVHVDDAIAAFAQAGATLVADPSRISGRAFAVSSGARWPLRDIVALVDELAGTQTRTAVGAYDLPERHIKTPWEGPALPGWRARISLDEGIRRFIEHRQAIGAPDHLTRE